MNSTLKGEMKLQLEENFPDDSGPAGLHLASRCNQISEEARDVFRSVLRIRKHIRQAECESKRLRVLAGSWSEGLEESATIFRASISKIGLQLNEQEKLFRDLQGKLFKSTGCKDSVRLDDLPAEQVIAKSRADGSGLERFCLEKLVESSEKSLLKNFLYCLDEKNKKLMDLSREKHQDAIYENLGSPHLQREARSCDVCSSYLLKIHQLEGEKKKLRETMLALRKEGKLLRADNAELLDQLNGLHTTLELKENEIRDFIMNFGIRVKESEMTMKALQSENGRLLKELLVAKRGRFQARKPAALNSQDSDEKMNGRNSAKSSIHQVDSSINRSAPKEEERLFGSYNYLPPNSIEEEPAATHLARASGEPVEGPNRSSAARVGVRGSRLRTTCSEEFSEQQSKDLITTESPLGSSGSASSNSESQYLSLVNPDCTLPSTCSLRTSPSPNKNGQPDDDKPFDEHDIVFSLSNSDSSPGNGGATSGSTRRKTLSKTLFKIFGKDKRCADSSYEDFFNPIEPSNMATKWQRWDVVRTTPLSSWTPQDVIIWLELECCVPAVCLARCRDNIKSGKALLNQTDSELAAIIGLTNPVHKLKLRLALEERKDIMRPASHLQQLDHRWVAHTWLRDLGLMQYSSMFEENLVDGRMLNELSKSSLEKYLHVSTKQHQASIFHGVDLLRMLNFDKESLYIRRANCLNNDIDLLVWSNERVSNWIRSIDLKEYADNLSGSGVHGALMILDSSFNADTLAQALQLPSGDLSLHSHLKMKLDDLLAASRRNISPSLLSKGRTKNRFMRTFSFRMSRESANQAGVGSFKLQRKTPFRHSTNSLPSSSRHLRGRHFSDAMLPMEDTDESLH